MKPEQMTDDALREEIARIDRMRLPLSGATMMRRNDLANELRTRPSNTPMTLDAKVQHSLDHALYGWPLVERLDFLDALRTGRTIRGIGRDRYEQSIQVSDADARRPRQRRLLRIEEPARKMRAQLDALKAVGN